MSPELLILLGSAAAIGAVHTLLGPDHYLPFVALSRARNWSLPKTIWITALCGLGHVLSSVLLGLVGIAAGITLRHLELIEGGRGEIAAWLLMAFGLVYGAWGAARALRGRAHTHSHQHPNGIAHAHTHSHLDDHAHPHDAGGRRLTPWILFTIFVFGPCEPLIPLLMFPAAAIHTGAVILVALVFGLTTIAVMTGVVLLLSLGMDLLPTQRLSRFGHALAGALVFLCGVAIQLGL